MSKQESKTTAAKDNPHFDAQRIYIKNTQFHAPEAAAIFRSRSQIVSPDIKLHLDTQTHKLSAELYEVTLKVSVTAALQKSTTTAYQVEVSQAGLFIIANYQEQDFAFIVNVSCPSILFPYARQVIFGLVERAGFPTMMLAPMNFEVLHKQYLQRQQQTKKAPAKPEH